MSDVVGYVIFEPTDDDWEVYLAPATTQQALRAEFGDHEGHPFRGNQWTGGGFKELDDPRSARERGDRFGRTARRWREALKDVPGMEHVGIRIDHESTYNERERNQITASLEAFHELGTRYPGVTENLKVIDFTKDNPGVLGEARMDGSAIYINIHTIDNVMDYDFRANSTVPHKYGEETREGDYSFERPLPEIADRLAFAATVHEFGHATQATSILKGADIVGDMIGAAVRTNEGDASKLEALSTYALSSPYEAYAEIFAARELGIDVPTNPITKVALKDMPVALAAAAVTGMIEDTFEGSVIWRYALQPPLVASVQQLELGDHDGHPFRGNQWTEGHTDGTMLVKDMLGDLRIPTLERWAEGHPANTVYCTLSMRDLDAAKNGKLIDSSAPTKETVAAGEVVVAVPRDAVAKPFSYGRIIDAWRPDGVVASLVQQLELGDSEGHPFRGNQWTDNDGTAGETDVGKEGRRLLTNALSEGTSAEGWDMSTLDENDAVRIAQEVILARGADIAEAAKNDPAVREEFEAFLTQSVVHTGVTTEEEYGNEMARRFTELWTHSATNSETARVLQETVAAELNAPSTAFTKFAADEPLLIDRAREQFGDTARVFVQSQYDATQAFLVEKGISEVTLYRGMHFGGHDDVGEPGAEAPSDWASRWAAGDTRFDSSIVMNPASSWTSDRAITDFFAKGGERSVELSMTVPAADVISTPRTGVGMLNESEILVRNQPNAQAQVQLF